MRTEYMLVAMGALTVLATAIAQRRRGARAAWLVAVFAVVAIGLGGVLFPLLRESVLLPLAGCIVATTLIAALPRTPRLDRAAAALREHRRTTGCITAAALFVVLVGWLEWTTRILAKLHVVEPYRAMVTVTPQGSEDWRFAHITADALREPDPVLLWRNVTTPPYNSHRLRGAEPELPKPARWFRIMCYGDSNTDGPPGWGRPWPQQLADCARLAAGAEAAHVEVLNAGVTGYSSYQGLLLFERQVDEYRPDLVLVSFGWNDVAPASGKPDNQYRPPPPLLVATQRMLIKYEWYLCLMSLLRGGVPREATGDGPCRVSLADYAHNLHRFVDVGRAHGAEVVLLTRPFRTVDAELAKLSSWRRLVPAYNKAVLDLSRELGVRALDVNAELAELTGQLAAARSWPAFAGACAAHWQLPPAVGTFLADTAPAEPRADVDENSPAVRLWGDECHFTDAGHRLMGAWLWHELLARR